MDELIRTGRRCDELGIVAATPEQVVLIPGQRGAELNTLLYMRCCMSIVLLCCSI